MRRAASFLPAALGLVLLCVTLAMAVTSQTWRQREKDDFAKGELKGVSLLYDGALRLSPRLDSVHEGGQPYLWAIAEGPGGALFVSGGNDGTVLRVGKGEAQVFFRAQEPEVHALAVDKAGNLLAGASPGGKVYKIAPDGKTLWTYDSGEKYVWALVFDRDGALYAATGVEGRILKIDASGHGRVFFDSAETHIRSLMLNDKGELIAGTDGHGLVFRVSPAGEGFVLYDAPLNEIVALAPGKDGTIYAAVADESGRPASRGPSPPPPPPAAPPPAPGAPGSSESATPQATPPPPPEQGPPPEQRVPIGMEGKVLAISRDGYAREIWAGGQEAILSLAVAPDGNLLMGSSNQGRIYGVDAAGNVTELLRLASAQVTALLRRSSGDIAVAGSNSGSVSLLRSGFAASGTYESRVLDARSFATWGRASWRTETPKGTSIALGVRCGNTEEPDRTWTDWRSAPFAQDSALLDCPASRFLQWRAQLKTDDSARTPSLREVAVTYLQANLPPEIKKVDVQAPGVTFQKMPGSGGPGGPSDSRGSGSSGSDVEGGVRKRPRPQSRRGYDDGARSINWQASDPNDDDLLYDVYYRAADEKTWKKIRDRIDEDFVTLDSHAMPDGTYIFRVVATDAPSNAPGRALTAEKLSAAFDVDNTPPRIENIKAQVQPNALRLTFAASDSFSIIRETACSVDAGDWLPLQAADGLDDSRTETYDVP
ncbi:MAG TPA: hypothetical protein VN898_12050, partial [Candidatus Binatia bacterium]|nr:hypothetical protein [Candidatus Binatia bacterium]